MSNPSPRREKLDEEIVRKKSIPAQIVLWVVVIGLLVLTYVALSSHSIR